MLGDTVFRMSQASPEQALAFIGFAVFTVGFFVWVALLARRK